MNNHDIENKAAMKTAFPNTSIWLWLSIAAAFLAIAGNVLALSIRGIYASLTPVFLPQALAQDSVNLAVVAPMWLILATLALRGSVRAYLLWLGVLIFTIYNYVIYTFAVPFGALFPLWLAVFGLCLFSLIGGITATDHKTVKSAFSNRRAVLAVAWILIITAALFGLLWLSEDVPALLSSTRPQSLIDMGIPTNPVHILDLAFFLPASIFTGVLLIKRKTPAYTFAPGLLVFLLLTGIPILVTPVIQTALGETAAWGVVAPIGTLSVILVVLTVWFISTIRPQVESSSKKSGT